MEQIEKELRLKVARCCRILEYLGLIDFSGHVSARVPGTDHIFINGWGTQRCKVTEKDIVKIDLDGNLIEGNDRPPAESPIHTSIYRMRPDVHAVAHLHPPVTTTLFITNKVFKPVIYHGSIFSDGIPVYDDCRHINTVERGDKLAKALGDKAKVVILRGHGCAVATESVERCLYASVYLEDNAEKLYQAYQIGEEPKVLSPEEITEGSKKEWNPHKLWNYYYCKAGLDF